MFYVTDILAETNIITTPRLNREITLLTFQFFFTRLFLPSNKSLKCSKAKFLQEKLDLKRLNLRRIILTVLAASPKACVMGI